MAAITHPHFQFKWIKDEEREKLAKQWLEEEFEAARPHNIASDEPIMPLLNLPEKQSNPLFDFDAPACQIREIVDNEIVIFLNQPDKDLNECFKNLPILRELFVRYNTPVPSSATLERAFSLAKSILSPQRGRLSDERFEASMILNLFRKKPALN